MIDLKQKKEEIWNIGQQLFHEITNLSKDIRSDDKERTGIVIVVREPKINNLILVQVEEPSEKAVFHSVEKVARMEFSGKREFENTPFRGNHDIRNYRLSFSSQNTANLKKFRYAGAIALGINVKKAEQYLLQVSTSGLKAEEDVLVSVIVLCLLTGFYARAVIGAIEAEGGEFPLEFKEKGHYLYNIIERYNR